MTWVLILYIYAGAFAKGDSVTLHSVAMPTKAACEREGQRAQSLVQGSYKELRYVCMEQK